MTCCKPVAGSGTLGWVASVGSGSGKVALGAVVSGAVASGSVSCVCAVDSVCGTSVSETGGTVSVLEGLGSLRPEQPDNTISSANRRI